MSGLPGELFASPEFWLFVAAGFAAQLIDGALGMAYGVICIALLSAGGVPPAQASAVVHAAEMFTTAASGTSHAAHRNIDWRLFARLAPAGVAGGVLGTFLLLQAPADIVRPLVALYLAAMGVFLLRRAFRRGGDERPGRLGWAAPLGGLGGLLDSWGGGWGPVVASTLMGGGHVPRKVVGTVSLAEFFVASAISAAFLAALIRGDLPLDVRTYATEVAGLVVGGLAAAPLAGFVARFMPGRHLTFAVGALVLVLAVWQVVRAFP